ncbi:hypothetical protein [Spirosoma aerophilum]
MNMSQFNQFSLPEQVVLVPIKGSFVAERQSMSQLFRLYYWGDHFIEIYYQWPAGRGVGAQWEPYYVGTFTDGPGCSERLMTYVDHLKLDACCN